jgi:hypothetical protein
MIRLVTSQTLEEEIRQARETFFSLMQLQLEDLDMSVWASYHYHLFVKGWDKFVSGVRLGGGMGGHMMGNRRLGGTEGILRERELGNRS